jgi:predicted alpha/beta superfamily hydrolase
VLLDSYYQGNAVEDSSMDGAGDVHGRGDKYRDLLEKTCRKVLLAA